MLTVLPFPKSRCVEKEVIGTMTSAVETDSSRVYDNPVDDPQLYPSVDALLTALQDPGKRAKNGVMQYPLLMKVLGDTQKVLKKKYSGYGMPKNPTDCKKFMAYHIVRVRTHRDDVSLPEYFRQYAKDGKVYVINDNTTNGGFNIILSSMLSFWLSKKTADISQRTPNDAMRVASILLDEEHRTLIHPLNTSPEAAAKRLLTRFNASQFSSRNHSTSGN